MLLVVALLSACGGSSDRRAYVAANQLLFAALPRYPGSEMKSETSAAYRSEGTSKILGYRTRFEFSLPPQAYSARVAALFRRRLGTRWLLVETRAGPVLDFRRGNALISFDLDRASGRVLEVTIDHAYYGKLGRCGIPGGCGGSAAWAAIRRSVLACRAKSVSQTHSLRVSVTLRGGGTIAAQEPRIDAILDVLNAARCRAQPTFATE